MRFYIDTCIWIDLLEDRKGFNGEPLGEYASRLFSNILTKKHTLVISDILIRELEKSYTHSEIFSMIKPYENILIKIRMNDEQFREVLKIIRDYNVPEGDAAHAVLSRDYGLILISRDRHFDKMSHISKYYLPEFFFDSL